MVTHAELLTEIRENRKALAIVPALKWACATSLTITIFNLSLLIKSLVV